MQQAGTQKRSIAESLPSDSRASQVCWSCGESTPAVIYEVAGVPTHCGLLLRSRAEALRVPAGELSLVYCHSCGFVHNQAFDPALVRYSADYNETQSFSQVFNQFQRSIAERLVADNRLHGKRILEIGCGRGEFLSLLCQLGDNKGTGFDPAYSNNRIAVPDGVTIGFVDSFFTEASAEVDADFICCNMTLEHIANPREFIAIIRKALLKNPSAVVFFLLPDAARIFREAAFWDIYYEHCNYFTRKSLDKLLQCCGLRVIRLEHEFENEYLSVLAASLQEVGGEVGNAEATGVHPREPANADAEDADLASFSARCAEKLSFWRDRLRTSNQESRKVAIWGGGSKAVGFLTALAPAAEVAYVIDINPARQGTFSPKTGHPILAPEHLRKNPPGVVIVMNPIYREEIARTIEDFGIHPTL